MELRTRSAKPQPVNRWRIAGWGGAALLLLLPLVAMQFTGEVNWNETDFLVFGAMLAITGGALELAIRMAPHALCRAGFAVALLTAFLLVWANLAVGIIGSAGNPANSMYYGVLALGVLGAVIARGRPAGMARAMVVMAIAMALVPAAALTAGWSDAPGVIATYLFTGMVCAAWLASAWLFRRCRAGVDRVH